MKDKLYFAKLLPVEGEIKGWVRQKSTGRIYYQQYGNNAMYDEPNGKLQFILSSTIDFEKVELLLCSRDIQVGDTVQFQLLPNVSPWRTLKVVEIYEASYGKSAVLQEDDFQVHTTPDNYCFKVIGEISEEATWVKDGDGFGEDEVDIQEEIDYDGQVVQEANIFIKGPCGHFH